MQAHHPKRQHQRKDEKYAARKANFAKKHRNLMKHNSARKSYKMTHNKFSDMASGFKQIQFNNIYMYAFITINLFVAVSNDFFKFSHSANSPTVKRKCILVLN